MLHHTPTLALGCAARLPRSASNGRALAAEMHGSLLRCLHHTYSHRVHCSPATPRLRWQDSLLIELHHTYSRIGTLLACFSLPATTGLAAQMPASQSPTRVGCTASPPRPA
eukprot:scaffold4130_cov52-Phaeocystis_antarctica.AAC.2